MVEKKGLLGVDDPQSKNDISRLIIDLYNGANSGTMTHGQRKYYYQYLLNTVASKENAKNSMNMYASNKCNVYMYSINII